jgi:hypothetical protein
MEDCSKEGRQLAVGPNKNALHAHRGNAHRTCACRHRTRLRPSGSACTDYLCIGAHVACHPSMVKGVQRSLARRRARKMRQDAAGGSMMQPVDNVVKGQSIGPVFIIGPTHTSLPFPPTPLLPPLPTQELTQTRSRRTQRCAICFMQVRDRINPSRQRSSLATPFRRLLA